MALAKKKGRKKEFEDKALINFCVERGEKAIVKEAFGVEVSKRFRTWFSQLVQEAQTKLAQPATEV